MAKSSSTVIDFNSVLIALNLIVACLIGSGYWSVTNNDYIDQQSIVLALVLSLQTHVALTLERVRRDPFVILLAFTTIFYFSLRIFTLELYPFSTVFLRYPYGPQNSNYALIFIIIANMFLYAGFHCVKVLTSMRIGARDWVPTSPTRVILLMVVSIIFSYFSGVYWTPDELPRTVSLLGIFIAPAIILLMALSYLILFGKVLDRKSAIIIGTLIICEIAAHTLSGSRSAITTLAQNIMLVMLGIAGCIKFRKSYFIWGCLLTPVVLTLLIGAFAISSFNRSHKDSVGAIDVTHAIALAGEAASELGANSELELVLPPIFDRAGFFDYSAEIIANSDRYKEVFNLTTYAKSIVDNVLTPGFDVYDQPKISNALQFVYEDLGAPSKELVTEAYQSDQFGVYGEFYALFGYAALPVFFLVAFLLKRVYVALKSENPFSLAMKRLVVLSVFVKMVDSYGVDWTIIETIPFVVAIYVYKFFFRSRRRQPPILPSSATASRLQFAHVHR